MKYEDYLRALERDPEYRAAEQELRPFLDLADEVLRLRAARDWSQEELAERVGTKQANISRLESGLSNPTLRLLQRVAAALDSELVVRLRPRLTLAECLPAETTSQDAANKVIVVENWGSPNTSAATWNDAAHASTSIRMVG